jgi:hypothetical protein
MAKNTINEVDVLRFFELESLDKATVLYNIVADKMQTRLGANQENHPLAISGRRQQRVAKAPRTQAPEPANLSA